MAPRILVTLRVEVIDDAGDRVLSAERSAGTEVDDLGVGLVDDYRAALAHCSDSVGTMVAAVYPARYVEG